MKCRTNVGISSVRVVKPGRGWKYFQPVIKVFAERPLLHHGGKIAMGGRDEADVNLMRAVAAEPLKFLLLQNA